MRVIHVAPTSFGRDGLLGGGERFPLELARALAPHVDCRFVTFGGRPSIHRDESGLEIVVLKVARHLRGHPAHPLARGLTKAIGDADVVHVHQMRAAPSRIAALSGRVRGQKLVGTDHGLGGGGWGGILPRLFDRFFVVSRYSAETLRVPAERTRIVYGGVDTERFRPRPGAREGILFVGRITPHKGIDVLLRAVPEGAKLTIVGSVGHDPRPPESGYPDLVARLAEERDARSLGEVDDDRLAELYRSAAVVVLPSVEVTCYGRRVAIPELLGLTLLEAMASGTPVICSNVGGLPEVVEPGRTGYVVPPGDVDDLRARISQVLDDPVRANAMGAAGRAHVLDRFTWDRCAARCLSAYAELSGAA